MSFLSFLLFMAIGLGLGVPAAKRLLIWIEKILQGQRKMRCITPYIPAAVADSMPTPTESTPPQSTQSPIQQPPSQLV